VPIDGVERIRLQPSTVNMKNPKHYVPVFLAVLLLAGLGFASSDTKDLTNKVLRPLVPERGLVTFAEGHVEVQRGRRGSRSTRVTASILRNRFALRMMDAQK
jgi:hypothetical protein